jgi:hypothetical protein
MKSWSDGSLFSSLKGCSFGPLSNEGRCKDKVLQALEESEVAILAAAAFPFRHYCFTDSTEGTSRKKETIS